MSTAPAFTGSHPLLSRYLAQLIAHPLRTKAITTGILCFLQEALGSTIAGTQVQVPKNASSILHLLAAMKIDLKAFKMAIYGFLISAPISHYLTGALQKAFAGKSGIVPRIGQILANSLLVSPIQATAFLASMSVINGAKTVSEVINRIRKNFFAVLRIMWMVSPVTLVVAQKFIPPEFWVPFFNSVQFALGTFLNVRVKRLQMIAARKAERDEKEGATSKDR